MLMAKKILLLLLLIPSSILAQDNNAIYFGLDNDGVFGVDQDYTNGIFINYSSTLDLEPNSIFYNLPTSPFAPNNANYMKWSVQVGQKMWTPSDIEATTPQQGERPYAGLLFAETSIYALTSHQISQFSLMLGTMGETSYAEEGQKFVHSITKSDDPNGWHNQIEEPFLLNISHKNDIKWQEFTSPFGWEHELSSNYRIMAGNFRSEVAFGGLWRWGTQLADSFGSINICNETAVNPTMIRRGKTGGYFFTGIEGRYRFNDITIDGNRPAHVPHTDIEHLQTTAVLGAVGFYHGWGASFTIATKSRDFEQDKSHFLANGSLALFWLF